MKISTTARMNWLFRNGGCLDVAIGHGMVYDRNTYQHDSPSRIVRALITMLHREDRAREICKNG